MRWRSNVDTVVASTIGFTGRAATASALDHVASQASCGRAMSTSTGGQWKISSLT